MTQIKRRIGDYAASKFLNSQDVIRDGPGPAVITSVSEREVQDEKSPGGKRLALMIELDRWPDKGYDCNTTNIRVLQDMLGEDVGPDDLRGVRVYITTHETNFGRGILFQPPQDSMQSASAAARQAIADSRARDHAPVNALPTLELTHSHDPGQQCNPNYCDVARAKGLGHPVTELWPAAQPAPEPQNGGFVPMHQPAVSHAAQRAEAQQASTPTNSPGATPSAHVVGSGPQARRVAPSAPESEATHSEPSLGHANEQLPTPLDDEIPF